MTLKLRRLLTAAAAFGLTLAAGAQIPLQQSTASQIINVGPFVDSTDGNTEKTALTIANTDVKLSKNGASAVSKNSGGCTHDANGWYACTLDATDTNTVGRLTLRVHPAATLWVEREYFVYPATLYAALFTTAPGAAGGVLQAGTNTATVFTGAAASGATPATPGLSATGGAASTTGGGVAAPGFAFLGGAGAASTNGAAPGFSTTAGGTTTVSGNNGATFVGTGNGNALGVTPAGSGAVFSTAANANVTQFGGTNLTSTAGIPAVNATQLAGQTVSASSTVTFPTGTLANTTNLTAGTIANLTNPPPDSAGVTTLVGGLIPLGAKQVADSGTTTTLVDTALTQASDNWFRNAGLMFTSGGLAGQQACVTGFTASSDTVTFFPAVTTAVTTNDYYFTNNPACSYTAGVNVTQFGGVNGTFAGGRAEANMTHIAGAIVAAGTAQLGVNVVNFGGNAGTFASGRPEVNATHWAGTAVGSATVRADLINIGGAAVSNTTAQLGVNVVNAGGTTWNSGAITANTLASDAVTAAKVAADVGSEIMASLPTGSGPFPGLGIIDSGTAQAADAVSITLQSGFSAGAVNMVGVSASIYSSTNGKFARCVSTAYNDTTKVLTCTGLGEAPTGVVKYTLYATAGSALGAEIVEPNGNITRRCVEAIALAYMAGSVSTSSGTSTYKDPSNTTTRIVGTVAGSNRGTITITCPP